VKYVKLSKVQRELNEKYYIIKNFGCLNRVGSIFIGVLLPQLKPIRIDGTDVAILLIFISFLFEVREKPKHKITYLIGEHIHESPTINRKPI
jgi:hypothetical protein